MNTQKADETVKIARITVIICLIGLGIGWGISLLLSGVERIFSPDLEENICRSQSQLIVLGVAVAAFIWGLRLLRQGKLRVFREGLVRREERFLMYLDLILCLTSLTGGILLAGLITDSLLQTELMRGSWFENNRGILRYIFNLLSVILCYGVLTVIKRWQTDDDEFGERERGIESAIMPFLIFVVTLLSTQTLLLESAVLKESWFSDHPHLLLYIILLGFILPLLVQRVIRVIGSERRESSPRAQILGLEISNMTLLVIIPFLVILFSYLGLSLSFDIMTTETARELFSSSILVILQGILTLATGAIVGGLVVMKARKELVKSHTL